MKTEETPDSMSNVYKHPVLNEVPEEMNKAPLSISETLSQAFSLIFSLQKRKGFKRMSDLLETNPLSVIVAGLLATFLFFSLCFFGSQIALIMLLK